MLNFSFITKPTFKLILATLHFSHTETLEGHSQDAIASMHACSGNSDLLTMFSVTRILPLLDSGPCASHVSLHEPNKTRLSEIRVSRRDECLEGNLTQAIHPVQYHLHCNLFSRISNRRFLSCISRC